MKDSLNATCDDFGDLTVQHLFKGSSCNANLSHNGQTNFITTPGYGYDANGNPPARVRSWLMKDYEHA